MQDYEICNLALSHLGKGVITSLSQATKEARTCNIHYDPVRRAVLEDHHWDFAKVLLELTEVEDEDYTNWSYTYEWPDDCIAPRLIVNDTGAITGTSFDFDKERYVTTGKIEFDVLSNADLDAKRIVTNQVDAELEYTADIEDTTMFSQSFIRAFAYGLAAAMAIPLTGNQKLQSDMEAKYQYYLGLAKSGNANQTYVEPKEINSFVRARD